jgi:small subunit ribosomal protein S8
MILDPLADMMTRIRNAQAVGHDTVKVRKSKLALAVLAVLKEEGFVGDVSSQAAVHGGGEDLVVGLKYDSLGRPVIRGCGRVSKSGRRVYRGVEDLRKVKSGLGVSVVSTSKGVLSDREARRLHVGGEVLVSVY